MGPLSVMDGRQLDWSLSGLAIPKGGAEIDRDVMDQQLWAPISGSPFYSVVKTADQVGLVLGKLIPFFLSYIICLCTCVCAHATVCTWRSDDNLGDLVLSFRCMSSRNELIELRLSDLTMSTFIF